MIILPRLTCPNCGKPIRGVKVDVVPPAIVYTDCLRRCAKCGIGASNAKNPAKVKYIRDERPEMDEFGLPKKD
ncbi:MAG: hypothetical protein A2X35_09060 [Elusimicrobia bacterium GWA2_61_42]|nr:MAG: hypothetical protein A2X35_09060 [Elusimicrobia bacterium GWA2_61_42]OGR75731.1 MAG: hypothetical protein A2X38_07005 [Elusimicrobia bacterium GWC2_61_25]